MYIEKEHKHHFMSNYIDFRPLPIKINMNTNIPGKESIVFSRSVVYVPESDTKLEIAFEDYPFFTPTMKYPQGYLFSAPYNDRLKFFFNKNEFNKILNQYNPSYVNQTEINKKLEFLSEINKLTPPPPTKTEPPTSTTTPTKPETETETPDHINTPLVNLDDYVKYTMNNETVEHNIFTMLFSLFPISYPIRKDIKSSYQMKIKKTSSLNLNFSDLIPLHMFGMSSSTEPLFSYLEIDGNVYTVTELIWVNDIYNHSQYGKIYNNFNDLKNWRNMQKGIIAKELKDKQQSFINKYRTEFLKDYDSIKNVIMEISKNISNNISKNNYDGYNNRNPTNNIQAILSNFGLLYSEMESPSQNKDLEKLYNIFQNIKSNIENENVQRIMTSEFRNIYEYQIKKMMREIDSMYELDYIYKNYFANDDSIDFYFAEDETISKSSDLKNRFKKYIDFIDSVKQFDNKNTSSTNKFLQELIQMFLNKLDENNHFVQILNPMHLQMKSQPFEYFKEYLNTGVSFLNGEYSIEIRIDVIKGEINPSNKSNIHCSYMGEKLTDSAIILFEEKIPFWKLSGQRVLYDSNTQESILNSNSVKNKEKSTENTENTEKQKGGKKTKKNIRHLKFRFLKTRKHFYDFF